MTDFRVKRPGRGRPARKAIYQRFAAAITELSDYGGLPEQHEASSLWDAVWHLDAHHSTAIEGNTLVFREVKQLLDEGRAVGSRELKDYMEVLGYADAARWVYGQATTHAGPSQGELVSVTEIRQIHYLTMSKVWAVAPHLQASQAESPGNWRQHEIQEFAGGMKPPTFPLVPSEVDTWIHEANQLQPTIQTGSLVTTEVPEALAHLHCGFERIHPFIDGNGRVGRLLLNLVLVRLGWPPVVVRRQQRSKYLTALSRADTGELGPLAEIISRSVIDNLYRLIPRIAEPEEYVLLEALVSSEFSLAALKQAASRGRLRAIIGSDGRYRSSLAAVDEYRASKYSRKRHP
jgi:Fic family protein